MNVPKVIAIAALAALIATPAVAQDATQCGPLDTGLKQLADQYKEYPVWVGQSAEGEMMLTQSADKRTWTWINIKFEGSQAMGCVLASGGNGHISGAVDSGTVALFVPRGAARRIEPGRGAM